MSWTPSLHQFPVPVRPAAPPRIPSPMPAPLSPTVTTRAAPPSPQRQRLHGIAHGEIIFPSPAGTFSRTHHGIPPACPTPSQSDFMRMASIGSGVNSIPSPIGSPAPVYRRPMSPMPTGAMPQATIPPGVGRQPVEVGVQRVPPVRVVANEEPEAALRGPLGYPQNRPMCAAADPADSVGSRISYEWEEVSTVADGILRGPVDHLLREPERARCRLCGQSLTGNLVVDQCIICNYRLVTAMDFAWAVCERFCQQKADLQRQALAKRRHLEEIRSLAGQLRAEVPSQVHGYVMRTMNEPREKLQSLRQQLEDLHAVDGLGLSWSANGDDHAAEVAAEAAAPNQAVDATWYRFRESVDRRVARCAVQAGASPQQQSRQNSPAIDARPPRADSVGSFPIASGALDGWSAGYADVPAAEGLPESTLGQTATA